MESKPVQPAAPTGTWTFNRTSMESKLISDARCLNTARGCLLIEPVWNRNPQPITHPTSPTPSFNRTSMESKLFRTNQHNAADTLLIEPVWNRNKRKSLPIKEQRLLLIEPVWNRNSSRFSRSTPLRTFNRTSMESKHLPVFAGETPQASFNRTSMESKPPIGFSFGWGCSMNF